MPTEGSDTANPPNRPAVGANVHVHADLHADAEAAPAPSTTSNSYFEPPANLLVSGSKPYRRLFTKMRGTGTSASTVRQAAGQHMLWLLCFVLFLAHFYASCRSMMVVAVADFLVLK
jgi:hypothetical protein